MNREVEILKIGTILPSSVRDGKKTIMVVFNGGPIFDYYINILKDRCDDYKYLKTDKSIVGNSFPWLGKKDGEPIKGIPDKEPTIGDSYSINGYWRTSIVNKIIEDFIIITNNSVYAIHNVSKLREKRLNDLGI